MPQYSPNKLWGHINQKQWSDAEISLRRDADQANSIGFVNGVTKGNQQYVNYYHDGEYPLSTALRMKAPDSLVLALLMAYASVASVKDKDVSVMVVVDILLISFCYVIHESKTIRLISVPPQ